MEPRSISRPEIEVILNLTNIANATIFIHRGITATNLRTLNPLKMSSMFGKYLIESIRTRFLHLPEILKKWCHDYLARSKYFLPDTLQSVKRNEFGQLPNNKQS